MTVSYSFGREVYDLVTFYAYVKAALSTVVSTTTNDGTLAVTFPAALSAPDQATLATLVSGYPNTSQTLDKVTSVRRVSVGNATTTPLAAAGTYTGFFEDVTAYSGLAVTIYADVPGTLFLQFSAAGAAIDNAITFAVPAGGASFACAVYAPYVRVYFVNGAVPQTAFRISLLCHAMAAGAPTVELTEPSIADGAEAQLSRVVVTGRQQNGKYLNVPMGPLGGLSINAQTTAFDQLCTESLFPLVQLDFAYAVNPEVTVTALVGSGTVVQSGNMAVISSGAATSSSAALTSRKSARYRVGQGIRSVFTPVFAAPKAGNTQVCGLGNDSDGFFFGYDTTGAFGVLRRYNGTEYWTSRAAWNVDPMDGTGPSAQTISPQLGNVYMVQFQWLGFGMITFSIENGATGTFYPVHSIKYANTSAATTLYLPYLNCYAKCANSTNSTSVAMSLCCMSAFVEGTCVTFNGPKFGYTNYKSLTTSAFVPIMSIRSATTYQGKPNRISTYLRNVSASTDTRQIVFGIFKNPTTLTGATFATAISANSIISVDTAATAQSGGTLIFSFCCGNSTGISQVFAQYELSLEPGETMCCAAQVPTANITNACVGLNWVEDC